MQTVWKIIDWLMALLLAFMLVMVFTNVVLRYGFDSGLRPSVELSRLSFVWVVMLGAVVCLRDNKHLAVTEIAQAWMPKLVPVFQRLIWLVIITCSLMLLIGSYRQTISNWDNISRLTGLPRGLLYLSGIVSGGLMAGIAAFRLFSKDKQSTDRDNSL
jgi:TRAP-type C4-dicarboxylate transport system permease small subunit